MSSEKIINIITVLLIDPIERTVTKTNINGTLEGIRNMLDCELITVVNLPDGKHDLICDDEGLYQQDLRLTILSSKGEQIPFAGKGVIVSVDVEGDWHSIRSDAEELFSKITFLNPEASQELASVMLSESGIVLDGDITEEGE